MHKIVGAVPITVGGYVGSWPDEKPAHLAKPRKTPLRPPPLLERSFRSSGQPHSLTVSLVYHGAAATSWHNPSSHTCRHISPPIRALTFVARTMPR